MTCRQAGTNVSKGAGVGNVATLGSADSPVTLLSPMLHMRHLASVVKRGAPEVSLLRMKDKHDILSFDDIPTSRRPPCLAGSCSGRRQSGSCRGATARIA